MTERFANLVESLQLHGVEGYKKYKETGTYAWAEHDSEEEWSETDELSEASRFSTGGDKRVTGKDDRDGEKE